MLVESQSQMLEAHSQETGLLSCVAALYRLFQKLRQLIQLISTFNLRLRADMDILNI